MNVVWLGLFVSSVVAAVFTGRVEALSQAMLDSAKSAVDISFGLVGSLALWLGLLRILDEAGGVAAFGAGLFPLLRRLFPEIPPGHPALGAMVMNISANILGLGNAATPFGIKAMEALDELNGEKGTATNAMVRFLAINTAGLTIVPMSVLALRTTLGSHAPGAVIVPTLVATLGSACSALLLSVLFARIPYFRASEPAVIGSSSVDQKNDRANVSVAPWRRWLALALGALILGGLLWSIGWAEHPGEVAKSYGNGLLPLLGVSMVLYGFARGIKVYEAASRGAKEGFDVAIRVLPFLVLILMAVGIFRASGLMDQLVAWAGPLTSQLGLPADVLPQVLVRPLSASGALATMSDLFKHAGPDSFSGQLASVLYGSSETTFYILAVYFGAVSVRRTRQALWVCLSADLASLLIGLAVAHAFFPR